jgi:multiple antibiotic resistance protein
MVDHLFSLSISLFLLMDPIGNVPIFLSVLKETSIKRHFWIILRELIIALLVIIGFYFLGDYLLKSLQIKQCAVMIAGGIILFIIALRMIFPASHLAEKHNHRKEGEPFIVPLAIPLVAGPAVLAAVILYSHEAIPATVTLSAIFLAWIASTAILLCSSIIKKFLGMKGIIALERLMGLLLTLIAVQMFLEGLRTYLIPACT